MPSNQPFQSCSQCRVALISLGINGRSKVQQDVDDLTLTFVTCHNQQGHPSVHLRQLDKYRGGKRIQYRVERLSPFVFLITYLLIIISFLHHFIRNIHAE